MSDVFREVDEDLRREQLKRLWDRFAPYILGLAVLIVLGVSAYKIWEYVQRTQAEGSGDRFVAALNLADAGKTDEAVAALQAISKEGSGGYPVLAQFAVASQKADKGDTTGAVADFDALSTRAGVSDDIRNMARLRAAMLLVDSAPVADITKRVGDLAAVGNPWRHNAREAMALSAWHAGDLTGAQTYFQQINADQEAPSDMRQRAQVMLALIAVKKPATAPAAAAPAVLPVIPGRPSPGGFAPAAPVTPSVSPFVAPTLPSPAPAAPSAPEPASPAPSAPEATPAPAAAAPAVTPAPAAPAAPAASAPEVTPAPSAPAPAVTPAPAPEATPPAASVPAAPAPAPEVLAPAATPAAPATPPPAAEPAPAAGGSPG